MFGSARLRNLRDLGFPIERVITTGHASLGENPKADALRALAQRALVDDYLPFLFGLPTDVHKALLRCQTNASPNTGPDLALVDSHHADLADFTAWWLGDAVSATRRARLAS